MNVPVKVLKSFYDSELGKPFSEGTDDVMPLNAAKANQTIGFVQIVGEIPAEKPAKDPEPVETAEMPEAGVEKAVKRSSAKRSKK